MPQAEPPHDGRILAAFIAATTPETRDRLFAEIVQRHGPLVLSVCRRVLHNEQDAQDAAQATFIALALKAACLTGVRSLAAWLHHVAWCIAADLRKAEARRSQREKEATVMRQHQQEEQRDLEGLREILDRELDALPEKYRLPVLLHHLQGLTVEEGSAAIGLNPGTFAARLARAKEMLRKRLSRHSARAGALVPAVLVSATAGVMLPPLFVGTTAHAATLAFSGNAAAAGTSVVLAKAALNSLFYSKLKVAAAVAVAALIALSTAAVYVRVYQGPATRVVAGNTQPVSAAEVKAERPSDGKGQPMNLVSTRGASLDVPVEQLRQAGMQMLFLGKSFGYGEQHVQVPVEMRFKQVDARELVEAVAAAGDYRVAWYRDGKIAVLYAGASDPDVEQVRAGLEAADVSLRRDAAWRAGWLRDIRAVPLLVIAAQDADPDVARQARLGLRRMNLSIAQMCDESVLPLLAADLASPFEDIRRDVAHALSHARGEQALIMLEKLLADPLPSVRSSAANALGTVEGEKAKTLDLLEKALADPVVTVRMSVPESLGQVGGARALVLLEKALADPNDRVRGDAVWALVEAGGKSALPLLRKAFADKFEWVRRAAIFGLARLGRPEELALLEGESNDTLFLALGHRADESALAFLEKALTGNDEWQEEAAEAIGDVGGERALTLLEKALSNPNERVRRVAIEAAGKIGGDRALAVLDKALAEGDKDMRFCAVQALWNAGGEKAWPRLEKALADKDVNRRCGAAAALNFAGGEKRFALLEQALADADWRVRVYAAFSLGRIDTGPDTDASGDHPGQHYSFFAPGRVDGAKSLALLKKALADENKKVRGRALSLLETIGGETALQLLEPLLSDRESSVREDAYFVLGRVGGEKVLPRLEKLLSDPNKQEREFAVKGLHGVGGEKGLDMLVRAFEDKESSVRCCVAHAIGWYGSEKILILLEKALKDKCARVRIAAICGIQDRAVSWDLRVRDDLVAALKAEKDEEVKPYISNLLELNYDEDPEVRKLLKLSDPPPKKVPPAAPGEF